MRRVVAVVAVALAACGSGVDPATETTVAAPAGSGATSPELAVSSIIRGITESDDALLGDMTLTSQLGLVALVEGASVAEAEAALGFASERVAAQFWSSFASGLEDFLGAEVDDIAIGAVETVDVAGARYATVDVAFPLDRADRSFVVTDQDGWKVDLVATFPGALLPHIDDALERASGSGGSPEVEASIRGLGPSLDALGAVGVPDELSDAFDSARSAISPG